MKNVLVFLFFICFSFSKKEYSKTYYPNKNLKEEGWIVDNKKTDYWFYYYENGLKKEEGHYQNNQKVNWWIFYDEKETITKKCEFKNNLINGFSIIYLENKIVCVEKYNMGKKIKHWNSIYEFKKDNPSFK